MLVQSSNVTFLGGEGVRNDTVPLARAAINPVKVSYSLCLVGRAPPPKCRGESDETGDDQDRITVRTELLGARSCNSAEQSGDGPREPIAPAQDGGKVREEHGKNHPAEGRQVAAATAGKEGNERHQRQSQHCRPQNVNEGSSEELHREARDYDQPADHQGEAKDQQSYEKRPDRNDHEFSGDDSFAPRRKRKPFLDGMVGELASEDPGGEDGEQDHPTHGDGLREKV